VGLILGVINTFLFTRTIKLIELSVAYPVFSGACFALISLVSMMAFGEPLRRMNILGLLLVVVGIVLVTQSE
jgi:small multidrug resistance pump